MEIEYDGLYEHLYTVYTEHRPRDDQHLGYVDKSQEKIGISLGKTGIDLEIRQLLLALNSKTQLSSTGFICWQTAVFFADWAAADPRCFLYKKLKNSVVLELGAGVSAVLASVLGPESKHYVASDQAHVVKLTRENLEKNVISQKYTSVTTEKRFSQEPRKLSPEERWSKIDVVALDWEFPEQGFSKVEELTGNREVDYILACDTIYNTYLVAPFVACMKRAMGPHSVAVVAMQLRDESVTEAFLEAVFDANLRVFRVRDDCLTPELIQGFVVYCLVK